MKRRNLLMLPICLLFLAAILAPAPQAAALETTAGKASFTISIFSSGNIQAQSFQRSLDGTFPAGTAGWMSGDRCGYAGAYTFLEDDGVIVGRYTSAKVNYVQTNDKYMAEGVRFYDGTPDEPDTAQELHQCPGPDTEYGSHRGPFPVEPPTVTLKTAAGEVLDTQVFPTGGNPAQGALLAPDYYWDFAPTVDHDVAVVAYQDVLGEGVMTPISVSYFDALDPNLVIETNYVAPAPPEDPTPDFSLTETQSADPNLKVRCGTVGETRKPFTESTDPLVKTCPGFGKTTSSGVQLPVGTWQMKCFNGGNPIMIDDLHMTCVGVEPPAATPTYVGGGLFSTNCLTDHTANDDPIVFPGQPGATHLHQFFGHTDITADTVASDLPGGGTTCDEIADTAAYWMPTLVDSAGNYLAPARKRHFTVYYVAPEGHEVQPFPEGLVMVADASANPTVSGWSCFNNPMETRPNPYNCASTQLTGFLKMSVHFAPCWDGVNLDSADHRSHMAYLVDGACPASHPVELVHLVVQANYTLFAGSTYHLAPNPDGSFPAVHADFMNGWDQAVLTTIVEGCVNAGGDCQSLEAAA